MSKERGNILLASPISDWDDTVESTNRKADAWAKYVNFLTDCGYRVTVFADPKLPLRSKMERKLTGDSVAVVHLINDGFEMNYAQNWPRDVFTLVGNTVLVGDSFRADDVKRIFDSCGIDYSGYVFMLSSWGEGGKVIQKRGVVFASRFLEGEYGQQCFADRQIYYVPTPEIGSHIDIDIQMYISAGGQMVLIMDDAFARINSKWLVESGLSALPGYVAMGVWERSALVANTVEFAGGEIAYVQGCESAANFLRERLANPKMIGVGLDHSRLDRGPGGSLRCMSNEFPTR